MTNPKRGEITISLAKQEFHCKITMDVMMRIETAMGKSVIKVANTMQDGDLTALQMVAFLKPVLRSSGKDIKDKDVQELIWNTGITDTMMAIAEIITFIITGNEKDGEQGNVEQAATI